MKRMILIRVLKITGILGLLLLAGCGGSSTRSTDPSTSPGSSPPPSPGGGGVTVSTVVSLSGTVPPATEIVSFGINLSGLTLQPGDVNLLDGPMRLDIKRLEASGALIRFPAPQVTAGTFTGLTAIFSSPELTIEKKTGGAIGTCANGDICQLHPQLQSSTVSLSAAPFPLTLDANSITELRLDFDLSNSISSDLGSVNPILNATSQRTPIPPQSSPKFFVVDRFPGIFGRVVSISVPLAGPLIPFDEAPAVVAMDTPGGRIVVNAFDFDSYDGFAAVGCSQIALSCLQVGQEWEVSAALEPFFLLSPTWDLEAKGVRLATTRDLEGVVVAMSSNTQLDIVVLRELPDFAGVDIGDRIHVNLLQGTTFQVQGGISSLGLNFAAASDLMLGQVIRASVSSGPSSAPLEITTNKVTLTGASLTAQVKTGLDADNFLIDKLPGIFTNGQIHIETSSATVFENISNVAALRVGDTVSLGGLLFKTASDPVLVASRIRKR
jgi:hypothetical protein